MTAFTIVGVLFVVLLLGAAIVDAFSYDDVADDPEAGEDEPA